MTYYSDRRKRKSQSGLFTGLFAAIIGFLILIVLYFSLGDQKGLKPENAAVYVAIDEIICTIDPSFLDSSPLTSPANFTLVSSEIEFVVSGSGGLNKKYWCLTPVLPDVGNKIYVYDHIFRHSFKASRYYKKEPSVLKRIINFLAGKE